MEKVLTISIAAYNAEKYLERCLDSFAESAVLPQLDVLVIDDGSTDGTAGIAEKYENRFPGSIRLIRKENGGHGSTINTGIENAAGKYFKTVDADDWVDGEGINLLVRYLQGNDVDLVLNPYKKTDESGRVTGDVPCVKSSVDYGKVYRFADIAGGLIIAMHAFTFRTAILKRMGMKITEHCFYVDAEYTIFPLSLVETASVLNFTVYMYLYGTADQSMNMQNMVRRREQHLGVLWRVVEFYNEQSGHLKPEVKTLMFERIIEIVKMQYVIFFAMDDLKESRIEVRRFDRKLKAMNTEVYIGVLSQSEYNSMKLLKAFRSVRFRGYRIAMRLIHAAGLV